MKKGSTQAWKDNLSMLSIKSASLDADKLLFIYAPPAGEETEVKTFPIIKAEIRSRVNWQD